MKKLLILGTSFASTEIVRKARQRGWYTIVTDNVPVEKSPVKKAADDYWMISTADTDLLEEKCREEGIGAVFAAVSEFNLDKVLILTKKLGLPCYIDEGAWKYARNKQLFKRKCIEKGIPVVDEYPVPDPDDETTWEKIVYPVVVKPVDGAGNTGVSICYDRQQLEVGIRKAAELSDQSNLIIERYITGTETWNYYYAAEGTLRYTFSRTSFKQPGYPTYLYSFLTTAVQMDDYLEKMNPQCTELLSEIGCREGIAWIQCIRDDAGNFYALEMAHRLCGCTSGDMQEKFMQFDCVEWLLDTSLGVKHTADQLPERVSVPYPGAQCTYFLFADHTGEIDKITGLDQLDLNIYPTEVIVRPGKTIEKSRVMAHIAFYARTTEEICDKLQYLNQVVSITDTEGKEMVIHFTDFDAIRKRHQGLMHDA